MKPGMPPVSLRNFTSRCTVWPAGPPELGIPSNWIVDELRQGERVNVFENAQEYIEAVRESYRRDIWQDQECYVELWGEKGTVLGTLRPIAREWGLMLRVCRGFGSAAMEDQVGRLFEGIDKPITVFYVGDFDASGVLIERDMHGRVQVASGVDFDMIRLAIQVEDIARFDLPPQAIKNTDSRAASFREQFGENAATVELEALPIQELKRRVEQAVSNLIDVDRWNRQVEIEKCGADLHPEFRGHDKQLAADRRNRMTAIPATTPASRRYRRQRARPLGPVAQRWLRRCHVREPVRPDRKTCASSTGNPSLPMGA